MIQLHINPQKVLPIPSSIIHIIGTTYVIIKNKTFFHFDDEYAIHELQNYTKMAMDFIWYHK